VKGDPWWSRDSRVLLASLSSDERGLTTADAEARLLRDDPNALDDTTQRASLRLLLRQFASPLVLILVFGAVVCLVVGDWIDAAIILSIVLGSTLLGFSQEFRASRAVAELRQRLALKVRVRRDGAVRTLEASRLAPADGLLLDSSDLLVSEASLTGESMPV